MFLWTQFRVLDPCAGGVHVFYQGLTPEVGLTSEVPVWDSHDGKQSKIYSTVDRKLAPVLAYENEKHREEMTQKYCGERIRNESIIAISYMCV